MESVIRNVWDLGSRERRALEDVLGKRLEDNQQVMIQVVTVAGQSANNETRLDDPAAVLPDWCRVYDGLTEEEIAQVEEIALQRSDLTRTSE
jgi:hypothetical protein